MERYPPNEGANGCFPEIYSTRSSVSVASSQPTSGASEATPQPKVIRSHTGTNPLSPLERDFQGSSEELDVATQLGKRAPPRSLHDNIRRAANMNYSTAPEAAEVKAKKLADAKKELLALAARP